MKRHDSKMEETKRKEQGAATTNDYRWQSESLQEQIREFLTRPIDGVRFAGVGQEAMAGKPLLTVQFKFIRHGLDLNIILPPRFPDEEPNVVFVYKIPQHPDIDPSSGVVDWSKYGQWTPTSKIRDIILCVKRLLETAVCTVDRRSIANAQVGIPPTNSVRFKLSHREFHHFLGDGVSVIDDLKRRYGCRPKYCGMGKKDRIKDPHFQINGNDDAAREMTIALDEYLVAKRFRKVRTIMIRDAATELTQNVSRPAPTGEVRQDSKPVGCQATASARHFDILPEVRCCSSFVVESTVMQPVVRENAEEIIAEFTSLSSTDKFTSGFEEENDLIDFGGVVESGTETDDGQYGSNKASATDGEDLFEAKKAESMNSHNSVQIPDVAHLEDLIQSPPVRAVDSPANITVGADTLVDEPVQTSDNAFEIELPEALRSLKVRDLANEDMTPMIKKVKKATTEMVPFYYDLLAAANRRLVSSDRKLSELSGRIPLSVFETIRAKSDLPRRRDHVNMAEEQVAPFQCPLCMQKMSDVVLSCGDIFCARCVSNLTEGELRSCPMCQVKITRAINFY